MRWLILSDLHSNEEALTAVLDDARVAGFDQCAVLGDIVGYGASPNEVIGRLRDLAPVAIIRGNHDRAAVSDGDLSAFNHAAAAAMQWTRETLDAESRAWLGTLKQGPLDAAGFLISHGCPFDEDEYLLTPGDGEEAFASSAFGVCFFGHTHLPSAFELIAKDEPRLYWLPGEVAVTLRDGARYLINPGSIGQPRDSDPRAAYAILDSAKRELSIRRVSYDTERACCRIIEAGLPESLGRRLAMGV